MKSSIQLTLFRVLLPTIFIAIVEVIIFFVVTKKDIEEQIDIQKSAGHSQVETILRKFNPDDAAKMRTLLQSIHTNVLEQKERDQVEKSAANRKAFRNALLIVLGVILFVMSMFWFMPERTIAGAVPWKDVLIQTVGTVLGFIAFQIYFYKEVGLKYGYATNEELQYELTADVHHILSNNP
jgi:hypothetical protein